MKDLANNTFAFIKPASDAHTLGVNAIAELLKDCGYEVVVAEEDTEHLLNDIRYEANQEKPFKKHIKSLFSIMGK